MIIFRKKDRDDPNYTSQRPVYRNVMRTGKWYAVGGDQIELFTMTTLAEAIDRTPDMTMRWWRLGHIPPSMFKVPGHHTRRWFSGVQIINLHNLMHYKYKNARSASFKKEEFLAEMKVVFYHRKLTQKGEGEFILAKDMKHLRT